jgi:hypothetical protein
MPLMRVLTRTVRFISEEGDGWYAVDLKLSPVGTPPPPPAFIQWATETHLAYGCLVTLDYDPTPGTTQIGFVAQRSGTDTDMSDMGPTCFDSGEVNADPVAGTTYTYLTMASARTAGDYPMAMAYDTSTSDHTIWPVFLNLGSNGRSRGHIVELSGIAAAPTDYDTSTNQSTSGVTFTSPSVHASGPGYVFGGMSYSAPGPGDGSSSPFTMTPHGGAVTLTAGYAIGSLAPYSWFGYKRVETAGSYSIGLERVGTPRNPTSGYGWVIGFWPDA